MGVTQKAAETGSPPNASNEQRRLHGHGDVTTSPTMTAHRAAVISTAIAAAAARGSMGTVNPVYSSDEEESVLGDMVGDTSSALASLRSSIISAGKRSRCPSSPGRESREVVLDVRTLLSEEHMAVCRERRRHVSEPRNWSVPHHKNDRQVAEGRIPTPTLEFEGLARECSSSVVVRVVDSRYGLQCEHLFC